MAGTLSNEGSASAKPPANVFFRYPNDRIFANIRLERMIMIWVWLVVPLQYFIFVQIPGGKRWNEFFDMALAVSLSMLLVFICSSIIAFVPSKQIAITYADRVRAWSLAIITNWSAAVTLLAASYFWSWSLKIKNKDLVQFLLCPGGYRDLGYLPCENYPELFRIDTYLIYLIYSLLALALLLGMVVSITRSDEVTFPVPAPRTLLVPIITAALLTGLYSFTKV